MLNEESSIVHRLVQDKDMPTICSIYADEVLQGVSSWENTPPSLEEMIRRRDSILAGEFPYIVAEHDGEILGYAYASSYRPRPGYRYTVENSIYISDNARGRGIGKHLLIELIKRCEIAGYRQMIAVIGDSSNDASIGFHTKMGFEKVGVIKSIGFKFGRWMDSVIMQKALGSGGQTLPEQ